MRSISVPKFRLGQPNGNIWLLGFAVNRIVFFDAITMIGIGWVPLYLQRVIQLLHEIPFTPK